MRRLLLAVLMCSCAFAQSPETTEGPDFSRAARPRGGFYLNGIGHQYLQGTDYTVVAAAIPVLNGKFFGVKVHVINRGTASVDVLPEDIAAEDSLSAKHLALLSAAEVNDRLQRPSGMARMAGAITGEVPMLGPGGNAGAPTITDLLREMMKEAAAENPSGYMEASYPTLTPRGAAKADAKTVTTICDLGCELRNREIGDGTGPQLLRRLAKPELVERSEFLANTLPPEGDAVGVLYFAMPKMTDKAPISHNGRKSYRVTLTVPVGTEKFQFVFPPE
jgi:hypothetical protein